MISFDDFTYALENTRVLLKPHHVIETFGLTSFRFQIVTEPMDEVGIVCVRTGQIHAERPRIVAPQHMNHFLLEGFGAEAEEMLALFEKYPHHLKVLRYGFLFKKTDIAYKRLPLPKEEVLGQLHQEIEASDDKNVTLIEGIDDAWEVCLLKFTIDLIERSAGENVAEWKRRGFI